MKSGVESDKMSLSIKLQKEIVSKLQKSKP